MSVGDIMREIDAKSLLSGDFILIDNPATFSSSNLSKQITNFKCVKFKQLLLDLKIRIHLNVFTFKMVQMMKNLLA